MNEVDAYIDARPEDVQQRLRAIQAIVREEAPEATEEVCMGIPTFRLNGKWFVHYGATKQHIGFYPQPSGVAAFKDRLTGYKTSKGTIQFPLSKPLPLDLIREIVQFRYRESTAEEA